MNNGNVMSENKKKTFENWWCGMELPTGITHTFFGMNFLFFSIVWDRNIIIFAYGVSGGISLKIFVQFHPKIYHIPIETSRADLVRKSILGVRLQLICKRLKLIFIRKVLHEIIRIHSMANDQSGPGYFRLLLLNQTNIDFHFPSSFMGFFLVFVTME